MNIKFNLAPWRALVYDERLGYASPFKHPPQTKQRKKKTKLKSARKRRSPLNLLAIRPYSPCGSI